MLHTVSTFAPVLFASFFLGLAVENLDDGTGFPDASVVIRRRILFSRRWSARFFFGSLPLDRLLQLPDREFRIRRIFLRHVSFAPKRNATWG